MFLVTRGIWQLMLAGGGQTRLADVLERHRVSQLLRDREVVVPCRRQATGVFVKQGLLFHYLADQLARDRYAGPRMTVTVGGWCLSFGTRAGIRVPAYLGARVRWLDESGPG
jgi:hypothetical protein